MDLWLGNAAMKGGQAERIEGLFGGLGEVSVVEILGAAGGPPPFASVLACELAPRASVGMHVQEQFSELVIVVEGSGLVTAGMASVRAGAGTVVPLPLGERSAIQNESADAPLRYLIVKTTPPPAV